MCGWIDVERSRARSAATRLASNTPAGGREIGTVRSIHRASRAKCPGSRVSIGFVLSEARRTRAIRSTIDASARQTGHPFGFLRCKCRGGGPVGGGTRSSFHGVSGCIGGSLSMCRASRPERGGTRSERRSSGSAPRPITDHRRRYCWTLRNTRICLMRR